MSYTSIIALLKTALLLLSLAQGPNVPKSLHDQAVSVANQAIAAATVALVKTPNSTVTIGTTTNSYAGPVTSGGGTSIATSGTCAALPLQTQALTCPTGQTGAITQTRTSSCPGPAWSGWTTTSNTCLAVQTTLGAVPMGWDYDLKKKCARTTGTSADSNYFSIADQCGGDGKHWVLAVESENAPGKSAPGPINRSFMLNGPASPVTVDWIPHTSSLGSNWTVHMKVDHATYPHPNGQGYFTYFGMMDHENENGGPLPLPLNLETDHALSFTYWTPGADDAARMLVGAQFWWGGKAHILEIDLALSKWGDANPDPQAILVSKDWYGDGSAEYVTLDGTQMGLGIPLNTNTQVSIQWGKILRDVIAKGWFSPIGNQPSVTQAVYIGTEVKNQSVGDLWHTDFRTSSTTFAN